MSGAANFKNSINKTDLLASQGARPESPKLTFEREDWTLFRSVSTLSQKAGVPVSRLRRLILKELMDNALDAAGDAVIGALPDGGYFIEDRGSGIPGDQADIARLFSIRRPLISTKLFRLPSRGALGNGLRTIVGAVLASEGRLSLETRGRAYRIFPQYDGETRVESEPCDRMVGTRIEIWLGSALPADPNAMSWARDAIAVAGLGDFYKGKTSPHWYDSDAFRELLYAAGEHPVRELVAMLDGCTGAKAGRIAAGFKGRGCNSLTRIECDRLLRSAQANARQVRPSRLGGIGPTDVLGPYYVKAEGWFRHGIGVPADIPFVVEVWASTSLLGRTGVTLLVNRTPITGELLQWHDKKNLELQRCGIYAAVDVGRRKLHVVVAITTPYMPITTDGKEPNLGYFEPAICEAIRKAAGKLRRALPKPKKLSHKAAVIEVLDAAIQHAGGGGRFTERQLFYAVRKKLKEFVGVEGELSWGNFEGIITEHEAAHGEICGMTRDPRGTLLHPHTGEDIPVGTLSVEKYTRPAWLFNKVLFVEKEGFNEILKADGWPKRNDCALLSSKGYSTRAVRDLLDLMGETDEPSLYFCVHDADAAGGRIFETLVEETLARPGRKVKVINLGLEPWEAIEMGLDVEPVEYEKRQPVAKYVLDRQDRPPDYPSWGDWLQHNRVELNAMTTPQFIAWLDGKMSRFGNGKLVPPEMVIQDEFTMRARQRYRVVITERILREARIDDQVSAAMAKLDRPAATELVDQVETELERAPADHWTEVVERLVVLSQEASTEAR